MQWLHLELMAAIGAEPVFAETCHGYGETNPCADLASLGRLRELHDLCDQLGVKPVRLELPEQFLVVLRRFRARFGPKFARHGAEAAYQARQLALEARPGAGKEQRHPGFPPRPAASIIGTFRSTHDNSVDLGITCASVDGFGYKGTATGPPRSLGD